MADEDEQMDVAAEVEEEVVAEEAPAELNNIDALRIVLRKALVFQGLRRGLHEYDMICIEIFICRINVFTQVRQGT